MDNGLSECTECWCVVAQGMERAHEEWHQKQAKATHNILELIEMLRDWINRVRNHILESEGRAP